MPERRRGLLVRGSLWTRVSCPSSERELQWCRGGLPSSLRGVSRRYPYPCCGHLVLAEMFNSYRICPVCFWEDDGVQFRWPTRPGGANRVSLVEAQRNYQDFGACEERSRSLVRPAAPDEPLDPRWRPIDLKRDSFEEWEAEDRLPWPDDRSVLCWWLPTFWRRPPRES